jgi:hypothetical protein
MVAGVCRWGSCLPPGWQEAERVRKGMRTSSDLLPSTRPHLKFPEPLKIVQPVGDQTVNTWIWEHSIFS